MRVALALLSLFLHTLALPTDRAQSDLLFATDPAENTVNVDEKAEKVAKVEKAVAPLGSQFAVGHTHPERRGLVTGHRIPLGLFPVETQSRILGLEEDAVAAARYVEASSFRRPARLAVLPLPPRELQSPAPAPALATLPLPPQELQPPAVRLRVFERAGLPGGRGGQDL